MRSLRFLGLFLLPVTLVALGCGEQTSPTDPGTASALADGGSTGGELTANQGNGVVFSARGSGHSQGPGIGGSEAGWRTFTFNAIQREDGTTTGHMRYDTHDQGDPAVTHEQHGLIFCMTDIGGGIVLIGAEGTLRKPEDNPSNPLGLPQPDRPNGNHGMLFAVRDNGEGANATDPDQFTGAVHTLEQVVALACGNPTAVFGPRPDLVAEQFFNDVEAGNIQVTLP